MLLAEKLLIANALYIDFAVSQPLFCRMELILLKLIRRNARRDQYAEEESRRPIEIYVLPVFNRDDLIRGLPLSSKYHHGHAALGFVSPSINGIIHRFLSLS